MTSAERHRVDAAFRAYVAGVLAGAVHDPALAALANRLRETVWGKGNDSGVTALDVVPRPQVTH